ncbi:head-tail adaptor protein [Sphingobium phenoxybenzoativorans]|uniref:Head-tail adaptor protein n=1 Tax=Sphingobium phenoxybenzoativorans TaxID=1592790 RepID=A0A975Q3V2_9SPHN|nr:head-tail adaptor protein [Sphingobium phenoxybenzoativorans]QUT07917.1 head-tail adaptor protein [Sphingobium phenoxybenzoativorans]
MGLASRSRNRKIVFEKQKLVEDDEYGGEVLKWTTHCREWASVNFGSGQERRSAAQETASQVATFQVLANRATNDLSVKDRLCYPVTDPDPKKWPRWDITSIVPSKQDRRGWDVTAVTVAT